MGVNEFADRWNGRAVAVLLCVAWAMGCASVSGPTQWPEPELALAPPSADPTGEPRLVRGEDGRLYAIGAFDSSPRSGQFVFGRHDGNWPLTEMAPPALFAGQVVDVLDGDVALVQSLYQFPDTEPDTLRAEFRDDLHSVEMGKGVGQVLAVEENGTLEIELSTDSESGVQPGDIYGVLRAYEPTEGRRTAQLTRRIRGTCKVISAEEDETICRMRQGHPDHQWSSQIAPGQTAIFLEPRFSEGPRQATVKVAPVEGSAIDERVEQSLRDYLSRYPEGAFEVASFDRSVDARDIDFHRWNRRVTTNKPSVLVGLSIEERDGQAHLIVNYTGLGNAVGPGMVAAPPEAGVDMGPVDDVEDEQIQGFAAMLTGALFVYRGQTSEALMHLNEVLRDPVLQGKWRWHARDQYAMRWAALDRHDEAFWLVQEDEAVARGGDDVQAYLNALGTRVRLHGFVDQPKQAWLASTEYLEARRGDRPDSTYLSALAMYGEMALEAGELEAGREALEELVSLCPDGCQGDVLPLLAGIYWAALDHSTELQDEIVSIMVDLGRSEEQTSLATARMFQGWSFMRDDDYMQSLIAFLEARRLFEREESEYGQARADFYIAVTQIARERPQEAFDKGMEVLAYMTDVGDHASMVRIYERLAQLYVDIDISQGPQPYLGAAPRVLQGALQAHMSTGDYGRAAEAGFGYGHFLFRVGSVEEARYTLQRAVLRGLRVARFDMVSLCHIFLAVIARSEGNMELFEEELDRARTMADAADDPYIDELIEELLSPSEDVEDPTQLL